MESFNRSVWSAKKFELRLLAYVLPFWMNSVTTENSLICVDFSNINKPEQTIEILWNSLQPSWLDKNEVSYNLEVSLTINQNNISIKNNISDSVSQIYTFHEPEFKARSQ